MIMALAMPPPSHITWSPQRPSVRSSSCTRVAARRAPEQPSGWPMAMAQPVRRLLARDEHGCGAVADLRRVARRDHAVGLEGGLEVGELLEGGVGPEAFVAREEALAVVVGDLDGDDLALEAALLRRAGGPQVRLEREAVVVLT